MLKRFHRDDGTLHPGVNLQLLSQALHALYTHWLYANGHRRDFVCAVEHAANMVYVEYLACGKKLDKFPPTQQVPALKPPRKAASHQAAIRFYDECDAISVELPTDEQQDVLATHFPAWVASQFAARDFVEAVRHVATLIVYDHGLAMSMGGLGGAKDAVTFLTQPYSASVV